MNIESELKKLRTSYRSPRKTNITMSMSALLMPEIDAAAAAAGVSRGDLLAATFLRVRDSYANKKTKKQIEHEALEQGKASFDKYLNSAESPDDEDDECAV